jgi:hypothetical protein
LQQYETTSSDKYYNAKKSSAKAPYKKPDQQIRDANLKQMKQLLSEWLVTLQVYYTRIVDLYTFEPRKKNVEELVDTDESDVTFDEDDTDDDEAMDHDSIGSFAGATAVVYDDSECNAVENTNEVLFDSFNQSLGSIYTELQSHDQPQPMDIVTTDDDGKITCDICGRRFIVLSY